MTTVGRICAIAFALLLVVSMVTPAALAAEPAPQVDDRTHDVAPPGGQPNSGTAPIDENASSIELRFEAYQLLENATVRGDPRANDRLQERVNETFEYYVGPNRATDVRLFNLDTQVISRTKQTAPEVSNRLLASQARLADTTMADANRTVNVLEERNADVNLRRARQQLDAAQRQYQRGETRHERGQPNAAIAGYRHAFLRSNRLIDRLGRETDPDVEITRHADPVRNGSGNYTIQGEVFAVRSSQLDNLTVTVNGESQEVPLASTPATAVGIPFSTTVELGERTAEIEVEAQVRDDRNGRVVGTDSATLRLDGDGLSDRTEVEVTETDPLDPDSDASATAVNEADNGTIDGLEDFDGDGLAAAGEISRDLDPMVADTDDDGLSDGAEVRILHTTNATNPDTDGDGVHDGAEDPDGDGLNHTVEIEEGSHPYSTDGDRDGLTDPEELDLGTEPLLADSDDDRLEDGEELDLGTDPLDRDTDDDGVIDGNETYTTNVSNESLNASITFTGQGNVAADASVTNETTPGLRNDLVNPARATELIRLDAQDSFETAHVNFTYDESAVPINETDLSVYRFNRTAQFYEPVDSTVDPTNNTITGSANQTSVYTVLSPSVLADQFSVDPNANATYHAESFEEPGDCEGECGVNGGDLVVGPLEETSDSQGSSLSTSSVSTDGAFGTLSTFGYPVQTVTTPKGATEMTVSATVSGNAVETSSVSFRAGSTPIYTINSGSVSNKRVSKTISVSGGESVELRVSGRSPSSMNVDSLSISYNTGGGGGIPVDLCQTVPDDQGRECPDSAVPVYSIPISQDVANVTIRGSGSATVVGDNSEVSVEVGGVRDDTLASTTTNGTLSFSKTYQDLSPSSSNDELTLSIETTGLAGARLSGVTIWKDTDGDGFTDKRERIGFVTRYGYITTDPFDSDTDGDGLEDGEEVGELVSASGSPNHNAQSQSYQNEYYKLNSNPTLSDSDHDGLNDSVEAGNWTVEVVNRSNRIYRWDTGEPLERGESSGTVTFTSDPLDPDTDNDGLSDATEHDITHTDPESNVTYGITEEHQRYVVDDLSQAAAQANTSTERLRLQRSLESMNIISPSPHTPDSLSELSSHNLNDSSDDHDFVVPEDYDQTEPGVGRYSFVGLNRDVITDVWFPNAEEITSPYDIDPWDPDSDNDGLTDGQEITGIPGLSLKLTGDFEIVSQIETRETPNTRPDMADTDEDGYWDGYIGVYDVGRNDTVVLYMNNIYTGNGIQGNEVVPEQGEIHEVNASDPGADIDGDRKHSKVHIGEMMWGSDPNDLSDQTDTSFSIEVNYFAGNSDTVALDNEEWRQGIEQNFRLYGLDVNLVQGDQLSQSDLNPTGACTAGSLAGGAARASENLAGVPFVSEYETTQNILDDGVSLDSVEIETPWESAQEGADTGQDLTCIKPDEEGLTVNELIRVRGEHFSSLSEDDYMFVTPRTDSDSPWLDSDNTGINLPDGFFRFSPEGMAVFTEPSNSGANFGSGQIANSPYSDNLNMSTAAVAMHEIGHSYGVGRNDELGLEESVFETEPEIGAPDVSLPVPVLRHVGFDSPAVTGGFETYSGDPDDPTPEELNGNVGWSLMASHSSELAHGPMDGEYYVFSVEELTTIRDP